MSLANEQARMAADDLQAARATAAVPLRCSARETHPHSMLSGELAAGGGRVPRLPGRSRLAKRTAQDVGTQAVGSHSVAELISSRTQSATVCLISSGWRTDASIAIEPAQYPGATRRAVEAVKQAGHPKGDAGDRYRADLASANGAGNAHLLRGTSGRSDHSISNERSAEASASQMASRPDGK